ncbi:toll/interleukin-1 receptor domain-containing protein [Blastococcus sp. PRF04-17]|uniref:toll/interleukin-1 receptor domain-containing protein n=1 Tax=Blastococcus sp. PRF04-17 TaxID=2933797 RepID=UPI001FF10F5D|nr:toll/interleukin-1 receptor domain-containing protein [Blastococcus sp. PRF04-17]UOY02633.1 toll/interleukin-1 receptor domain-containing protein [Blastococcus sp. PRF04-17]
MTSPRAARRIFISHAAYDTPVAKVMKDVLGRAGVGRTFLDADDLRPGDHWLPRMKEAITDCDALITLLTPQFVNRPWMSAEWACFWAAEKTTYVLRLAVPRDAVFQPMQGSQDADLDSVASVVAFLDAVAEHGDENYELAERLVERVRRARTEQAAAQTRELMHRLVTSPNAVPESVIRSLIETGHVEDLLRLHERAREPAANLTPVRLRNVAALLQQSGVGSERLIPLVSSIGNSNYQRELVIAVLLGSEPAVARRAFADALFDLLTRTAKQRVVAAADDCGFELGDKWRGIPPFGE